MDAHPLSFFLSFHTLIALVHPLHGNPYSLTLNIKRSPNGMKPSGELFLEWKQSRRLGVDVREATRKPRGREARPTPLVAPLTNFFRLYMSIYPKNIEEHNRLGVPPPQASVATKNLSGARSGTLLERGSLTGGHLHHLGALHDEEGVVHPRG